MSSELLKKYTAIIEGRFGDEYDEVEGKDDPNFEVLELLSELEEKLQEAVDICRALEQQGQSVAGPFSGQLRAYTIPWLKAWCEDTNQPGSVASLRNMAERDQ